MNPHPDVKYSSQGPQGATNQQPTGVSHNVPGPKAPVDSKRVPDESQNLSVPSVTKVKPIKSADDLRPLPGKKRVNFSSLPENEPAPQRRRIEEYPSTRTIHEQENRINPRSASVPPRGEDNRNQTRSTAASMPSRPRLFQQFTTTTPQTGPSADPGANASILRPAYPQHPQFIVPRRASFAGYLDFLSTQQQVHLASLQEIVSFQRHLTMCCIGGNAARDLPDVRDLESAMASLKAACARGQALRRSGSWQGFGNPAGRQGQGLNQGTDRNNLHGGPKQV